MSFAPFPFRFLVQLVGLATLLAISGCYIDGGALVDDRWSDGSAEDRGGLTPDDAIEDEVDEGADNAVAALDADSDEAAAGDDYEASEGPFTEPLSGAIEPSHGLGESQAKGLIDAPEEVTVFVGEILEFDVYVTDPSLGNLLPATLPELAVFESLATGGRVRWQPRLEDIGTHDFVFLIVDADEPSLVVAQDTVSVDVLPRFSLVEYGF